MNNIYSKISIDKNIPVPLYYQLEQFMITNIENGSLKNGEMVPPEKELAKELNISRTTIRQAFSDLAAKGYIDRLKAKGTFISTPKIYGEFIQKLEPFDAEMKKKGITPSTKILKTSVEAPLSEVQQKLNLNDSEKVIVLERLRYGNDKPIVYVKTYLSEKKLAGIVDENLEDNSLYMLMRQKYGINVQSVNRKLTATSSDEYVSKLLQVDLNTAVLFSMTTGYDSGNNPVEYSLASYRSDIYALNVNLKVSAQE